MFWYGRVRRGMCVSGSGESQGTVCDECSPINEKNTVNLRANFLIEKQIVTIDLKRSLRRYTNLKLPSLT